MKLAFTSCLAALAILASGAIKAADLPSKWFVVEPVVNTESGFMLRVDVDKPDRTYREGEHMTVYVKAEKDCYLYLLYYGAADKVACLFPNKIQQDNFVLGCQEVVVPSPDADFQFTTSPPFGEEILHVVATLRPIDVLQEQGLTQSVATMLGEQNLKDMVVEVKQKKKQDWAEARIQITTVGKKTKPPQKQKQKQRLAVCVGISEYQHDRVPPLQVSHQDARNFAQTLQQQCGVQQVTVLTNSQATKAAIEQAIFHDLVQQSRPGDTVFIFFSCHGGRTADTNGDEKDGLDEYLVPHDGILGQPDTMILDDTFARWMRELDGRKIAIVLDNCYSGGSSKAIKGLPGLPAKVGSPDFFDGEMNRTKDLGQPDTIIIAASEASQLAWEMPSTDQGSVLTYYMLQAINDASADGNGDGRLTLGEAYRYIKEPIEDYVRDTFSADQNPVFLDNANDSIVLRP